MRRITVAVICALLASPSIAGAADWLLFAHDSARSGTTQDEHAISAATVHTLHRVWSVKLDSASEGSAVAAAGDLYITTREGVTYAIDAANGTIKWKFVTRGPGITTAMPAVDAKGGIVYAPGADAHIHKLTIADGSEQKTGGFPVLITLIPQYDKDSSALNLANGYLYATTSGYLGDFGPYVGHLVTVALRDGHTHVFNVECSNEDRILPERSCPDAQGGVWARAGAVVDPDPSMRGRVYIATGNGLFNANSGGNGHGDSVIALSANGATALDSFTPSNQDELNSTDMDLGSTAPAMLPLQTESRTPLLAVQGGKDGILRMLDRRHLGGVGGELADVTIGDGLYSQPAVANDAHGVTWLYVSTVSAVRAFRVVTTSGTTRLVSAWKSTVGGTSPAVANGLVFVAADGAVRALDARNGTIRWSGAIGAIHWESPIVANGRVYVSDESGTLFAFGL